MAKAELKPIPINGTRAICTCGWTITYYSKSKKWKHKKFDHEATPGSFYLDKEFYKAKDEIT